ncbi:MAG: DNA polymerase/3'-5' exonuclease PolX [Oligoflexia bacterium]|nr:DNA polymerase/3'-5' exonuclease PolX [Oligoflexia bacterium]
MLLHNSDVAKMFKKIADLLEVKGENPFRVRAYRRASMIIDSLPRSLEKMIEENEDLTLFEGIGKDLAQQIKNVVMSGSHPKLTELEKEFPAGINDLIKINGIGPKKLKILFDQLKINNLLDLEIAIKHKQLRQLPGFGIKTEENILKELKRVALAEKRMHYKDAEKVIIPFVKYLSEVSGVKKVEIAGSLRRKKETVGDVDLLAICNNTSAITKKFVEYQYVKETISHGKTRSSVILKNDLQVDLRVVPEKSYGAALLYFTGSKEHNVAIRNLALKKGMKINEYGVFREYKSDEKNGQKNKIEKRVAGKSEEEIYALFAMPYIEPELRENQGEIQAAGKHSLPNLIQEKDIRGDLHCHTTASDGKNTIEEMGIAAKEKGYEYLAITDHTPSIRIAGGPATFKDYEKHLENIDLANLNLKEITLLKGAEVEILEDGKLDLPNYVLKKLDIIVCSVHSHFKLSVEKQTERILRALDNNYFQILGHPTGRLIGERDPYEVDLERILKEIKLRGKAVELNSFPSRLDLKDIYLKMAKDMGVRVVISTDSHSREMLHLIKYGIDQARRGWLEANDVVNTLKLSDLKKILSS